MATKNNDPWALQWTIHDNQGQGGGSFPKNGKFTLVWNGQGGYYEVAQLVGMPQTPDWSQLQFFPHGETMVGYSNTHLLPKWDGQSGTSELWLDAANQHRQKTGLMSRRLAATFPGHDVLLIRVDAAVEDRTPLLLLLQIQIQTDLDQGERSRQGSATRQDGTAHGGHP